MKKTNAPLVAPSPPFEKKALVAKGSNPGAQFITMALDMSWKLMIVFLAPILLGNYLDSLFKATYLYLLIGFLVGLALGSLVVYDAYRKASNIKIKARVKNK